MPEAEVMLWSRLRRKSELGVRFRRQHPIGPYIADFACISAKLVIELDGATHATDEQHARDMRRDAYMAKRGWRVIRLKNEDIYTDLASVVSAIIRVAPPPSAARSGAASTSPWLRQGFARRACARSAAEASA